MDPLSITATCISLIGTIGKTSIAVTKFVRDVRSARGDLDAVSRDLLSLKTVLELLAEDVKESSASTFPQTLKKQIAGIVTNCSGVVVQIEETLKKHEGTRITKAAQWVAFGKDDVAKLQSSLEAHKSALELALDMVTLTLAKDIKADTQDILDDTSAIKHDTAQILAEIARLQQQLPQDVNRNDTSRFMLDKYLDGLTSYAETVYDTFTDGFDQYMSDDAGSIHRNRSSSPVPVVNKGNNVVQPRQKEPMPPSSPVVRKVSPISSYDSSSNWPSRYVSSRRPPPLPAPSETDSSSPSPSPSPSPRLRSPSFRRQTPPLAPSLPPGFQLSPPPPSPIRLSAIESRDEDQISDLSKLGLGSTKAQRAQREGARKADASEKDSTEKPKVSHELLTDTIGNEPHPRSEALYGGKTYMRDPLGENVNQRLRTRISRSEPSVAVKAELLRIFNLDIDILVDSASSRDRFPALALLQMAKAQKNPMESDFAREARYAMEIWGNLDNSKMSTSWSLSYSGVTSKQPLILVQINIIRILDDLGINYKKASASYTIECFENTGDFCITIVRPLSLSIIGRTEFGIKLSSIYGVPPNFFERIYDLP